MGGKTNITGIGVFGSGPSVRSSIELRNERGRVYIEVRDCESGLNTRTAKIALSPDKMVLLGNAMSLIGNGQTLDDINTSGFNRVSTVCL